MKRRLPDNVTAFVDRNGKERFRYRKVGRPVHYFKEHPGTQANPSDEYNQLVANMPQKPAVSRAVPGTIDELISRFYRSAGWDGAGDESKRVRRGILERFREKHGKKPVKLVTFEHIESILVSASRKRREGKRTVGGKEAARSLRKQLMRVFAYAVKLGMIPTNPVAQSERLKVPKTGGHHTWTEPEIAQYRARHPLGTKARLALEIMLWTWQRRGDARLFGRAQMRAGKIHYRQGKTGKSLWLPAAPQLLAAIEAMPATGIETFLVTDYGKPFSKAGFGNKMREWCDEAELPHCTAHGVRKAGARRAAQLGASNQGLKSVGGWSGDSEVATYTAEVDQAALAEATLRRVIEADLANRDGASFGGLANGVQNQELGR